MGGTRGRGRAARAKKRDGGHRTRAEKQTRPGHARLQYLEWPFVIEHLAENEAHGHPECTDASAMPKRKGARTSSALRDQCVELLRIRAAGDGGHGAPVLCPAILRRLRADRMFLAIGDRVDASGGNAETDEIFLHRVGAACAKREIVFARAALVAVAFDEHPNGRIFL